MKLLRTAASFDPRSGRLVGAADHLFDVGADPAEARDLLGAGDPPPELERWRAALGEFARKIAGAGDAAVDEEMRERLSRLGYAR
jgi:hypothetical protein